MIDRGVIMKLKRFPFLGFVVMTALVLAGSLSLGGQDKTGCPTCGGEMPENCTVIMVGRAASTDGSVMTTHTCDCGECDWTWRYIPAADHQAGSSRRIYHVN